MNLDTNTPTHDDNRAMKAAGSRGGFAARHGDQWRSAAGRILLGTAILIGSAAAAPESARGQSSTIALNTSTAPDTEIAPDDLLGSSALARGQYAVVIDLDENRLSFRKGDLVLWSAPIGTGMALRMEDAENEWDFSTPNGVFTVKYKEENPAWIAPDWFFVENGLPVPPPNDKSRFFPGRLGAAAVYLDKDLAIHGTDRPELLGQRVSHGCIRLENKFAQRLFHNVQIGTEVIIIGGKDLDQKTITAREMQQKLAANFRPAKKAVRDAMVEGWKKLDTDDLLTELERQLWADEDATRWSEVATILLERAFKGEDDEALRGLMLAVQDLPSIRLEREYSTFLADAYARGALRTLEGMSRLTLRQRNRIAEAIVSATVGLYSGEWDSPSALWPTRRISPSLVRPESRRGWAALERAEKAYRSVEERRAV